MAINLQDLKDNALTAWRDLSTLDDKIQRCEEYLAAHEGDPDFLFLQGDCYAQKGYGNDGTYDLDLLRRSRDSFSAIKGVRESPVEAIKNVGLSKASEEDTLLVRAREYLGCVQLILADKIDDITKKIEYFSEGDNNLHTLRIKNRVSIRDTNISLWLSYLHAQAALNSTDQKAIKLHLTQAVIYLQPMCRQQNIADFSYVPYANLLLSLRTEQDFSDKKITKDSSRCYASNMLIAAKFLDERPELVEQTLKLAYQQLTTLLKNKYDPEKPFDTLSPEERKEHWKPGGLLQKHLSLLEESLISLYKAKAHAMPDKAEHYYGEIKSLTALDLETNLFFARKEFKSKEWAKAFNYYKQVFFQRIENNLPAQQAMSSHGDLCAFLFCQYTLKLRYADEREQRVKLELKGKPDQSLGMMIIKMQAARRKKINLHYGFQRRRLFGYDPLTITPQGELGEIAWTELRKLAKETHWW